MMPPIFGQIDAWLDERAVEFSLFVLPAIVAAAALRALLRNRGAEAAEGAGHRARTVRRIGLVHFGLAAKAAVGIVPLLVSAREAGSLSGFGAAEIGVALGLAAFHLAIGRGERRLRTWARWADVGLSALGWAVSVAWWAWLRHFGAAFEPAQWPEFAISTLWPPVVLTILLAPRTGPAFSPEGRATLHNGEPIGPARPSAASAATEAFLALVWAVSALNALDWLIRYGVGPSGPDAG